MMKIERFRWATLGVAFWCGLSLAAAEPAQAPSSPSAPVARGAAAQVTQVSRAVYEARATQATQPAQAPSSPSVAQAIPSAVPEWRFAWRYELDDFKDDPVKARRFLEEYLSREAAFFAAARHPESGLTYDGWNLNRRTGRPESPRTLSAASKECLDLGICIKALLGDPLMAKVVSPANPSKAPEVAADILAKKLRSYQRYQERFPGFAGYVTWFESGEEMIPSPEWKQSLPTLDMGEMAWALLLAQWALEQTGYAELAGGYRAYNDRLQARAKEVLLEPKSGGVRGYVSVSDPADACARFSGDAITTGEHGVHEGQMIVSYLTLFGGLDEQVRERIWDGIAMQRVEHRYGTTWEGFWGSPHEEWAHLFLPYHDHSGFRKLFAVREKIRTQNAVDRSYPGFAASAHHPTEERYMSAAGIEGIGSQPLEFQDTYTPYGAFPLLLQFAGQLEGQVGLAWLHNMLMGPKMQGPLGAGEAGDNAGTGAAPVKTVDASFTILLALCGGLQKETAAMLQERGKYEQFLERLGKEYDEAFGGAPLCDPIDFAYPTAPAPVGSREYEFRAPRRSPAPSSTD